MQKLKNLIASLMMEIPPTVRRVPSSEHVGQPPPSSGPSAPSAPSAPSEPNMPTATPTPGDATAKLTPSTNRDDILHAKTLMLDDFGILAITHIKHSSMLACAGSH